VSRATSISQDLALPARDKQGLTTPFEAARHVIDKFNRPERNNRFYF
jgi:hypothetical protein